MRLTLVLLALGAAICCCELAHATTTELAIQRMCPRDPYPWPSLTWMAPIVDAAAVKHSVDAVVLVALMHSESNCRLTAVNKRTGATGLFQIAERGSANPEHITRAQLMGVPENIDLGARHLAGLVAMCGSLGGALHVYHGNRTCGGWRHDKFVRKVFGLVEGARRWIAAHREPRS
jgi:hypothetical protein